MAELDRRTSILIAATVALVAAGIAGLVSLSGEAPPLPMTHGMAMPPPPLVIQQPQPQAPVQAPPEAGRERGSADDSLATVARRYKAAKDLREFYDRALAAGGMANVWYALSALSRCSEVGRLGIVGMEQRFASYGSEDPSDPVRREAWRQWLEPCRPFETRPAPAGEMQRVIAKLKETPGLVAEGFRRFGESVPQEEQRAFQRAIVDSNEGDLIFAFGTTHILSTPAMNYASVEEAQAASRASTVELHAWALATCELGRDCTRGSEAWATACFVSGDCSDNNAEALATKTLGAETVSQVRVRKDEVVAAIKARNWAALGL